MSISMGKVLRTIEAEPDVPLCSQGIHLHCQTSLTVINIPTLQKAERHAIRHGPIQLLACIQEEYLLP